MCCLLCRHSAETSGTKFKKSRKIFFMDLGVRNAVIKQWAPLNMRNDVGQLWENYLMVERKKAKRISATIG